MEINRQVHRGVRHVIQGGRAQVRANLELALREIHTLVRNVQGFLKAKLTSLYMYRSPIDRPRLLKKKEDACLLILLETTVLYFHIHLGTAAIASRAKLVKVELRKASLSNFILRKW